MIWGVTIMNTGTIWQYLGGGILALAVVAGGVALLGPGVTPDPVVALDPIVPIETPPQTSDAAPVISEPVGAVAPEPSVEPETETATATPVVVEPVLDAIEPASDAEPLTDTPVETVQVTLAPAFQISRVDPDGIVVVSGLAQAGTDVAILISGQEAERVTADRSGQFTAILQVAPSDQPRAMTLLADPDGDAVQSAQTHLISPFGMAPPAVPAAVPVVVAEAEVTPEPSPSVTANVAETHVAPISEPEVTEPAEQSPEPVPSSSDAEQAVAQAPVVAPAPIDPVVVQVPEPTSTPAIPEPNVQPDVQVAMAEVIAPDVQTIPEPVVAPEPVLAPTAPSILVADAEGVRVLQPASAPPDVMSTVALDTITYDPEGAVSIAGRAMSDGSIRVYLDNAPIIESVIGEDGQWRSALPQVDTGVYTLRVDEVAADGTVISRIETPFLREEPETVAQAMADQVDQDNFQVAVKTVQPGNTLWAIAQDQYGDGVMYVHVFDANRDLIRDPDLIYPGQIFRLPEMDQN